MKYFKLLEFILSPVSVPSTAPPPRALGGKRGMWRSPHYTPLLVTRLYNKINLVLYKLADLHNVTGEWDWHNSNLERQLTVVPLPGYGRDRDRIHLGDSTEIGGGGNCPLAPCWIRPWLPFKLTGGPGILSLMKQPAYAFSE